jgi:L-ascorbate metabolism protein UlaG (beta-lactamase superfamily)
MNKSGTLFYPWGTVTMVNAEHSSTCGMHEGFLIPGGNAAGFVINFKAGKSVYHSGDTGVFGDMALIDELYRPDILLIASGGNFTMGPKEAAYACTKLFKSATTVIPMHFGTFPPMLPDNFAEFKQELEVLGYTKRLVDSYPEALGKWLEFK